MDSHQLRVNVTDLEIEGFAKSKTHTISRQNIGLVADFVRVVDDMLDLLWRQNVGKFWVWSFSGIFLQGK